MKKQLLSFIIASLMMITTSITYSQVGINTDGSSPDPSAGLDVTFSNKGFLPPRMNTPQRNAIASPATGLVIFNTDCNDLQLFNGAGWVPIGNSGCVATPVSITGNTTPCMNAVGEVYSVEALQGANGYAWTVPTGSIITIGQGTTSITVDFGTSSGAVFVSGYGDCWRSLGAYLGITLLPIPTTPVEGVHVPSLTQIVWNWLPVTGATGYKWNLSNDFSTASDLGTATSKTETSLNCGTFYTRYIWAYNSCSPSSPTTITQTTSPCPCGQPITDIRDGKSYNTVLIGGQCWMAQNLNIGIRINGSLDQTNNSIIEKYCWGDLESNCDIYGGLYQWDEMMQYITTPGVQGICPAGWHIPTDAEYTALTTFLGGESVAGGKMKETGYAHWDSPNTGATNESGFTALPGGYLGSTGSFSSLGTTTTFWSSSENLSASAWYRYLFYVYVSAQKQSTQKTYGRSVRCIQD